MNETTTPLQTPAEEVATPPESDAQDRTQAQLLIELAKAADLFHTEEKRAYADIPVDGHRRTYSLDKDAFSLWLQRIFYNQTGRPPGSQALQEALATLKAMALFDGARREVYLRVAGYKDRIYVDLGDDDSRAVEIHMEGWDLIKEPPVRFHRTNGMLALPEPAPGGSLDLLRRHVRAREKDFVLLLAYLVQALRPQGPYPVLTLVGEQGTGKSTASRFIRALIDPHSMPIRAQTKSEHDLVIAADNSWLLAFDNLSGVRPWLSDALCRLATGGGFSTRTLYTSRDEELFFALRPIMLNGIEDLATRPDLADRALAIQLETIPESERKTEAELKAAFEQDRPRILGALYSAVSQALAGLDAVKLGALPRMADFAQWAVAAEAAFPVPAGSFLSAYQASREEAQQAALESDAVAVAIRRMLEETNTWTGTTEELRRDLRKYLDTPLVLPRDYPRSSQAMAGRLRRIVPVLRTVGIEREDLPRSAGKRPLRLVNTKATTSDTSSSSSSLPTPQEEALGHDDLAEDVTSASSEPQEDCHETAA